MSLNVSFALLSYPMVNRLNTNTGPVGWSACGSLSRRPPVRESSDFNRRGWVLAIV